MCQCHTKGEDVRQNTHPYTEGIPVLNLFNRQSHKVFFNEQGLIIQTELPLTLRHREQRLTLVCLNTLVH